MKAIGSRGGGWIQAMIIFIWVPVLLFSLNATGPESRLPDKHQHDVAAANLQCNPGGAHAFRVGA